MLALAACTTERPADIASIAIDGRACESCPAYVSIDRGGRVREPAAHGVSVSAKLDRAYGDVLARFPGEEFESAPSRTDVDAPATVVVLHVRFRDGSVRSAPVAFGQTRSTRTRALTAWTAFAAFEADAALLGPRRRAIAAAFARHAVRTVVLEKLGCYGGCAHYTVTFAADGNATIEARCSRVVRRGRVRVAFDRVLLAAYDLGWLRPEYPPAAIDTEAARITLGTQTQTFASDGPDGTTWDVPFMIAENRLDQLVRDLPWSPAVLRRCA